MATDVTSVQDVTFNIDGTEDGRRVDLAAFTRAGQPAQAPETAYVRAALEQKSDVDWWQIIYQVAQFIRENNAEIGRLWSIISGGVSNIKRVINLTNQPVEVWKVDRKWFEPPYQTMNVGPNSRFDGEMWVPWADNQGQYRDHHMTIKVGGQVIAYIWQSGPSIRFHSMDAFLGGAPGVPGQASASGGERTLAIGAQNGTPGFAFVGYQR